MYALVEGAGCGNEAACPVYRPPRPCSPGAAMPRPSNSHVLQRSGANGRRKLERPCSFALVLIGCPLALPFAISADFADRAVRIFIRPLKGSSASRATIAMPATTDNLLPAAFQLDKTDAVTVTLVFQCDQQWRLWEAFQPLLPAYLAECIRPRGGLYLALNQGVACRRSA